MSTIPKKKWIRPEIILIASNDVESGGQPSFHEKTLTGIFTTGGGVKIGHIKNGPLASNGGLYPLANIS